VSGGLDLEQRYRRVLRLLPGYYRDKWEEDMVAAFLDGWLTGDPDEDSVTMEYDRPGRQEVASVAGLAARLYLGGAGAPRRYFAWGQAVRGTVLAVLLADAIWGLGQLVLLARSRHLIGWLPPPPAGGFWSTASYVVGYAWVVVFVALVLGDYRTARIIAALVVSADLAVVLHGQLTGVLLSPFASWAHWFLIDLAPVLAMAAFHRDAPPAARRGWLVALPACYLLVSVPLLAAELTGRGAWVPDNPGVCCILVSLLCLAHVPRIRAGRADTGAWSLTLMLLAAVAGLNRLTSLAVYRYDPHLIKVGLAELLIMAAAVALVAPDAARSQTAMPSPPPYARAG
jgi:hypothetical protein